MSIRAMIDAAGENNAAEMERNFRAVVSEKLESRLGEIRTQVVANMLGLQEQKDDEVEDEEDSDQEEE